MNDTEAAARTAKIVEQLRAAGRQDEAWELDRSIAGKVGDALLAALRTACDTVLTMLEAVDPESETGLEELRADIDAWLATGAERRHHI